MFGIEMIENETKCFGNNNAAILNLSVPQLRFKMEYHLTNYNYVREAVASGMALIYNVDNG